MKTLLIICIIAFCSPLLRAKLIIADTIGQEKAVRILASGLSPDRNIDIKPAKLSDALRELRQGKIDMVLSRYKLDNQQRVQLKVNCYRYALEPVVFVTSSRNRISNVSKKQLQEVLRGNTITWRSLGGEAYSIHLAMVKEGQPGIRALHKNLLKKKKSKQNTLKYPTPKEFPYSHQCKMLFWEFAVIPTFRWQRNFWRLIRSSQPLKTSAPENTHWLPNIGYGYRIVKTIRKN